MAITTKIQQIISELQAAEELLQKQTLANQGVNTLSPPTAAPVGVQPSGRESTDVSSNQKLGTSAHSITLNQEAINLRKEVEHLRNENQRLTRELYYVRKETLISKNSEQQALSENELLVTELTRVQSELEQYYHDKIALEAALQSTNELIERAVATISDLQLQETCKPE
ncbi:hypothetical protein ACI2J9_13710 [Pseudomonas fulva]|uniref:hypothetical protein n=1 Tax=Pseudomonas fulva TaxID=47880 RepID=UPI0038516965